jgi:hypothetical protein
MPDWGMWSAGSAETIAADVGNSEGELITAGNSNVKGSWVELTAATTSEISWIEVTLSDNSAGGRWLVDIGVGAASSEQVLIPNLHYDHGGGSQGYVTYSFPIAIPRGTRVAARAQTSITSATNSIKINIIGVSSSFLFSSPLGLVQDMGTVTATSGATSVDPGGTADTKGAWVELISATTRGMSWLSVSLGHDLVLITASLRWLVDIGVGSAGNEYVVMPNMFCNMNSGNDVFMGRGHSLPIHIPAGSRISARAQCSANTATSRLISVAVYGVS